MPSEYNNNEWRQTMRKIGEYRDWTKNLSDHERERNHRIFRKIKYDFMKHKSYVPCVYLYDVLKNFFDSNETQLSDSKKDKLRKILHEIKKYIRIHTKKEQEYGKKKQKIGACVIQKYDFENFIKTLNSHVLNDIFIRERMDRLSNSTRPRAYKSIVHVWKKFLRFLRVGKHGKKSNFGKI